MTLQIRQQYDLGQRVNGDPIVYVFEGFLREAEITDLIAAAQSNLHRAVVSDSKSGSISAGRTGQNCWVSHRQTQAIGELCDRIAQIVGLPLAQAESLQVIHYAETQEYKPHFDAWDPATERGKRCMERGGQRLVTSLLYLNDVAAGGGTCFPKLDMEVRALQGRMVLFHNCYPGTNQRHPESLHGGLPVEAGEKWACNLWFRERNYQAVPAKTSGFTRVI
jgi:prolyl 4-hydroxylase